MKPLVPCVLLVSLSVLMLCGCTIGRAPALVHAPPSRASSPAGAASAEHYTIQPGDLLVITFAGEPDYNQQVRVDWNGRINLPYVTSSGRSELRAAGLTASALAERISEFAKEHKVLINPRAQVLVIEYASQTFTVLGQVTLPGRYAFPRGVPPQLDLEEAIALAGGYTRLARQSLVVVKRGDKVYRVNLARLATHSNQERFIVIPGDIITVTERIF
jgi:polysaccharide biosynthesis/export protein